MSKMSSAEKLRQEINRDKKRRALIKELSQIYFDGLKSMGCTSVFCVYEVYWVFESESIRELYKIRKTWDNLEKIRKKYTKVN